MKNMVRTSLTLVVLIFSQCSIQTEKITENEILWDSWGIPHIYATDDNSLYFSFGWVQNANDPPFTCTIPTVLNPEDFPEYLAPNFMSFRPQQSANLLLADDDISFDELIDYKHSTNVGLAERILDDFLPLNDRADNNTIRSAFEVLKSWDRNLNAESKGAILFMKWIEILGENNLYNIFETPWTFDKPNITPDGIRDKNKALEALEKAAKLMNTTYGSLDISYGEIYHLKMGDFEYPANGGPGYLGLFRTLGFRQDEDQKFYAVGGDSFVAAVEFGEEVEAKVLLSYGNATQPGSKHIGDQLPLLSKKKLRNALRHRNNIEMHLEFKERYRLNRRENGNHSLRCKVIPGISFYLAIQIHS